MEMFKIRINTEAQYVVEVNDRGDTITFDPEDIDFIFRHERAYKAVNSAVSNLQAELLLIGKKQDKTDKGELMSRNTKARVLAYKKAFSDMRKAYDEFLGEGACDKIFGQKNTLRMFRDLEEALQPVYDKMKENLKSIPEIISNKYGDDVESGEVL